MEPEPNQGPVVWRPEQAVENPEILNQANLPHVVTASREGRIGELTASGQVMRLSTIGVALPSTRALRKKIAVTYGGQTVETSVIDVGPWFEHDDGYVFGARRPAAELGMIPDSETNPGTMRQARNSAGIDLSDGLIQLLGESPAGWGLRSVSWRFV